MYIRIVVTKIMRKFMPQGLTDDDAYRLAKFAVHIFRFLYERKSVERNGVRHRDTYPVLTSSLW